jgi:hypothetical protein
VAPLSFEMPFTRLHCRGQFRHVSTPLGCLTHRGCAHIHTSQRLTIAPVSDSATWDRTELRVLRWARRCRELRHHKSSLLEKRVSTCYDARWAGLTPATLHHGNVVLSLPRSRAISTPRTVQTTCGLWKPAASGLPDDRVPSGPIATIGSIRRGIGLAAPSGRRRWDPPIGRSNYPKM